MRSLQNPPIYRAASPQAEKGEELEQEMKAMTKNQQNVTSIVRIYRNSVQSLERIKSERFYHGTDVIVNNPRYKGPGIAVTDNWCPPDQVTVSLPNGNSWRYPIESVEPIKRQPGTGFMSSSSSSPWSKGGK